MSGTMFGAVGKRMIMDYGKVVLELPERPQLGHGTICCVTSHPVRYLPISRTAHSLDLFIALQCRIILPNIVQIEEHKFVSG